MCVCVYYSVYIYIYTCMYTGEHRGTKHSIRIQTDGSWEFQRLRSILSQLYWAHESSLIATPPHQTILKWCWWQGSPQKSPNIVYWCSFHLISGSIATCSTYFYTAPGDISLHLDDVWSGSRCSSTICRHIEDPSKHQKLVVVDVQPQIPTGGLYMMLYYIPCLFMLPWCLYHFISDVLLFKSKAWMLFEWPIFKKNMKQKWRPIALDPSPCTLMEITHFFSKRLAEPFDLLLGLWAGLTWQVIATWHNGDNIGIYLISC